jgi:predicted  nucleic acid-binding Zn-ribbon protein
MAQEPKDPKASTDEAILQQQYLRALSSFEGIILGQIDIKNKLGNRLNYSLRAGLIILSVIAVSILVLLLTLSAQITRISSVVGDMNTHFSSVADKMERIAENMVTMEQRAASLEVIDAKTAQMEGDMSRIGKHLDTIESSMSAIRQHIGAVRTSMSGVAVSIDQMNAEVQAMSAGMHRMGKPARSMNKMFPFP